MSELVTMIRPFGVRLHGAAAAAADRHDRRVARREQMISLFEAVIISGLATVAIICFAFAVIVEVSGV